MATRPFARIHALARWIKAPYNAYKIVAGDLGTKGGLVTDVDSRVLREDGTVIEGLYAAGNTTATVMGYTYPGPGSTIGPASVFGLRGAAYGKSYRDVGGLFLTTTK